MCMYIWLNYTLTTCMCLELTCDTDFNNNEILLLYNNIFLHCMTSGIGVKWWFVWFLGLLRSYHFTTVIGDWRPWSRCARRNGHARGSEIWIFQVASHPPTIFWCVASLTLLRKQLQLVEALMGRAMHSLGHEAPSHPRWMPWAHAHEVWQREVRYRGSSVRIVVK